MSRVAVYQRGWVINSQHRPERVPEAISISKGMGDQFSASHLGTSTNIQYIKGDG